MVGSADIYLKRLVLGLSVAVVALLAGMALYSLLSDPDEPDELEVAEPIDDDPAAPGRAYPGQRFEIGDLEFPLTVGCVSDRESEPGRQVSAEEQADDVYLVVIHNRGLSATDYVVSAELTANDGSSVTALAKIDQLRADEEREVVLLPDQDIADISSCSITGVQSDRRVLLSSG